MNYFDVYISYSLWVGPHLSSHSYPGQPMGKAARNSAALFPRSHAQIRCWGWARRTRNRLHAQVRCRGESRRAHAWLHVQVRCRGGARCARACLPLPQPLPPEPDREPRTAVSCRSSLARGRGASRCRRRYLCICRVSPVRVGVAAPSARAPCMKKHCVQLKLTTR